MPKDRRPGVTNEIVTFCNFVKASKNTSPATDGTPVVQLAALNAMRSLGGPHLRPVREAELLMAYFVNLRNCSLLPKCDRV